MTTISSVDADQLAEHIAAMYRDVANERAQRASEKYGAQTIELLAVKPNEETAK
jgi:hypothetical protein